MWVFFILWSSCYSKQGHLSLCPNWTFQKGENDTFYNSDSKKNIHRLLFDVAEHRTSHAGAHSSSHLTNLFLKQQINRYRYVIKIGGYVSIANHNKAKKMLPSGRRDPSSPFYNHEWRIVITKVPKITWWWPICFFFFW